MEKETRKQQQKGGSICDLFHQAKALLAQDEHPPSPPSQHDADEEEEEGEKEEEGSLSFSSQDMAKGEKNKKKGWFGLGRGGLQPKKNEKKKKEGSGLLQGEGEDASDKVLGKYAQLLQAIGGVEEGEGVDHEQVAAIMEQAKQWVEMEGAATGEGGKEEEG